MDLNEILSKYEKGENIFSPEKKESLFSSLKKVLNKISIEDLELLQEDDWQSIFKIILPSLGVQEKIETEKYEVIPKISKSYNDRIPLNDLVNIFESRVKSFIETRKIALDLGEKVDKISRNISEAIENPEYIKFNNILSKYEKGELIFSKEKRDEIFSKLRDSVKEFTIDDLNLLNEKDWEDVFGIILPQANVDEKIIEENYKEISGILGEYDTESPKDLIRIFKETLEYVISHRRMMEKMDLLSNSIVKLGNQFENSAKKINNSNLEYNAKNFEKNPLKYPAKDHQKYIAKLAEMMGRSSDKKAKNIEELKPISFKELTRKFPIDLN